MSGPGRPPAFERSQVVAGALDLFWEQGYARTSVQDIVDRTGISRHSFYEEFGDKDSLLLEACRLYGALGDELRVVPLRDGHSGVRGRAAIERYFGDLLGYYQTNREAAARACFMSNISGELAYADPKVRRWSVAATRRAEAAFTAALAEARRVGEVPEDLDFDATARALLILQLGVNLYVRIERDPNRARAALRATLDGLLPPPG